MALRTALVVALSALPLAAARAGGNPGLADAEPGFGAIAARGAGPRVLPAGCRRVG